MMGADSGQFLRQRFGTVHSRPDREHAGRGAIPAGSESAAR